MINEFPILCIDNFYENPDKIREYALSLEYSHIEGNYPGERTDFLHLINENFVNEATKKIIALLSNFNYEWEETSWQVQSHFQKILPFSDSKDDIINCGWPHQDGTFIDGNFVVCVIYLNDSKNVDSGTEFFKLKEEENIDNIDYSPRNIFYNNGDTDLSEYREEIIEMRKKFIKTLEVKSIYNRMILFDGRIYHCASNFFVEKGEMRLTQVFFIKLKHKNNIIHRCNGFLPEFYI